LQTLALPLGYAAIRLSPNGLAGRRLAAGYRSQAHLSALTIESEMRPWRWVVVMDE